MYLWKANPNLTVLFHKHTSSSQCSGLTLILGCLELGLHFMSTKHVILEQLGPLLSCSCSVTPKPTYRHHAHCSLAIWCWFAVVWFERVYAPAQTILGLMRQPRLCLMSQWSCFSFPSAEIIDVSYQPGSFALSAWRDRKKGWRETQWDLTQKSI